MNVIALTDVSWFEFLREKDFKLINFWTPTGWEPKKINPGDMFYLFLKKPYRKVGGYARYVYSLQLTVRDAWNKFAQANGASDINMMLEQLSAIRGTRIDENTIIGCILLQDPVFLPDNEFFDSQIIGVEIKQAMQKFKYIRGAEIIGSEYTTDEIRDYVLNEETTVEYTLTEQKRRIGQSAFREKLLELYGKCAVTREDYPLVLEAAHIDPYIGESSNHPQNGLILRSDVHKLFDANLLVIDTNYRVRLSNILSETSYERFENKLIELPENRKYYPSLAALERRMEKLVELNH